MSWDSKALSLQFIALFVLAPALMPAQTPPATAEALFEKARAAQTAGELEAAEAGYREYLRRFRPKPEVLANLGALLARRENFAEAIRLYREALRLDATLAPLHLNLGLAYLKQGQPAEAVTELDSFLAAQPTHRQGQQLRAMALLETERYADAEAQFITLMRTPGGGDITIPLGLSAALLRQGKADQARAVLDPVLAQGSAMPEAQLALGQLLLQEGRVDEGLAALEQARRQKPDLPQVRIAIGTGLWRKRQTAEAMAEWRAEFAANARSFEAAYLLGSALSLNAASKAEGERFLRRAVELRPHNARANYQLAKLVWQKSKSPEALTFLQRATQSDPRFREAVFLEATVLQSLGRRAEAAKGFARARELSQQELQRQQDLFSESPSSSSPQQQD